MACCIPSSGRRGCSLSGMALGTFSSMHPASAVRGCSEPHQQRTSLLHRRKEVAVLHADCTTHGPHGRLLTNTSACGTRPDSSLVHLRLASPLLASSSSGVTALSTLLCKAAVRRRGAVTHSAVHGAMQVHLNPKGVVCFISSYGLRSGKGPALGGAWAGAVPRIKENKNSGRNIICHVI